MLYREQILGRRGLWSRFTAGLAIAWHGRNQADKEFDDPAQRGVDAKKEDGEHQRHDQDHYRGRDRLLAGRPDDLSGFVPDLAEEFAGRSLGHWLRSLSWLADTSG